MRATMDYVQEAIKFLAEYENENLARLEAENPVKASLLGGFTPIAPKAREQYASLRQREKRLREMLKRLEFRQAARGVVGGYCAVCGGYDLAGGHLPDCELSALLKEGE